MEFVVWEEPKDKVGLKIVNAASGVMLVACDSSGAVLEGGHIITITKDGTLRREDGCFVKGIKTDSNGRILWDQ